MPNNDNNGPSPANSDETRAEAPGGGDGPRGESLGGPPGTLGDGPVLPSAGIFSTGDLDPLQAQSMPQITEEARLSRRQKRGVRKAGRARAKAFKALERIEHHTDELELAKTGHANMRNLPRPHKRFTLPRWTALIWVPLSVAMLVPVEQKFVAFLPGLSAISFQAALFISVTLEALAWWLGRSMAARFESIAPRLELRDSEKLALRVAVPLAVTIQVGLLVLRLIRTGQIASSIALTVAALAILAVSCFVHDASCSGREAEQRSRARTEENQRRPLRQAHSDYDKAHTQWFHATENLIVEPARLIVARIYEIASSTDALIRSRGGQPAPWPIPLSLDAQIRLAKSELPENLAFPEGTGSRRGAKGYNKALVLKEIQP